MIDSTRKQISKFSSILLLFLDNSFHFIWPSAVSTFSLLCNFSLLSKNLTWSTGDTLLKRNIFPLRSNWNGERTEDGVETSRWLLRLFRIRLSVSIRRVGLCRLFARDVKVRNARSSVIRTTGFDTCFSCNYSFTSVSDEITLELDQKQVGN